MLCQAVLQLEVAFSISSQSLMNCFLFQRLWNIWVSRYNRKASGKKKSIFPTPEPHSQQFIEIRCHACTCIIDFRCMVKLPKIYSAGITVISSHLLFSHQLGLKNKNSAQSETFHTPGHLLMCLLSLSSEGTEGLMQLRYLPWAGLARFAPYFFAILISFVIIVLALLPIWYWTLVTLMQEQQTTCYSERKGYFSVLLAMWP